MKMFKDGSVDKILNKSYYDIEVFYDPAIFPDAEKVDYMVNSIAVYNNITNKSTIFTIPTGCNITDETELNEGVNRRYNEICSENPQYQVDDMEVSVRVFTDEAELLKEFFLHLISLDTLFLIGFNSSTFDDPYVVNRGLRLVGERIYQYISEFGEISKFGSRTYTWVDYIKIDLLQMYKPVDAGGSGLGKSLPNFKLNTIAKVELNLTKLDLEDMNDAYKNNIVEFLTYNLLDVVLTFKLDAKLRFLENMWSLVKYNTSPLGAATSGRSRMYAIRNNLIYMKDNILPRCKKYGDEILWTPVPPD